ncbi:hypothetical protein AOC36_09500 [Erysipelothrix larvae]|uniref:Uncharacterized protein n=1 Tax=Erysipelothrix larvae TaxID=1514105 RepID=A0A0X8H184_9FIRM|nr:hypothetical protein [Erysipelothrix larvae]AMC94208.1 hypothetical protein AOC36_09500 [Erysipelothrix larvae]
MALDETKLFDSNDDAEYSNEAMRELARELKSLALIDTGVCSTFNGWAGTVTATKDHTGMVSLQGMLNAGTTTVNTVMCNVPNAYRPKENITVIARSYRASGDEVQPIRLSTDGNIAIATRTAGENVQINIQYRV